MTTVLETRDLRKVYDAGEVPVEALRKVDLKIPKGICLAIMGPSGSGKSTLLNLLGGIEVPSAGQVLLDGTDLATLSDDDRTRMRRRRIGFIFQSFNLLSDFTAIENVALPLQLDGVSEAEARRRAMELLSTVGMAERANHLPSQLSGGEQQRIAIARALVIRPVVLLADEPTGNLDSTNGQQIMALLRTLVDRQQHTVVMVTHDASVAAQADRVIHVRDGQVSEADVASDSEQLAASVEARPGA